MGRLMNCVDGWIDVRVLNQNFEPTLNSSASVQEKKRHTYDVISCGLQDSENEEPDLTTIQENILNKPTRYVTHNATVHKCDKCITIALCD